MSQVVGRTSWSVVSSLLLHLAALALAATASLPLAASRPLEFLELDLSALELASEGGGGGQSARVSLAPPGQGRPALPAPASQGAAAVKEPGPRPGQETAQAVACLTPYGGLGPATSGEGSDAGSDAGSGSTPAGDESSGTGSGAGGGTGGSGGRGDGLGPGLGSGLSGIPRDYLLALHSAIERHKSYPLRARRQGWEGEVRVRFDLEHDGRISAVKVIESSGWSVLDEAAAATLQTIERLPPPPASMHVSRLRLELPMVYRLTR